MLAIECGTCRSGRAGTARPEALGKRRCLAPSRGEAGLRGKKAALGHEEAVGCDAKAGMMMEAAPTAAFVVTEADLLLELLVVALDQPAGLGGVDQVLQRGAGRQVGQPVLARLLGPLGPLDQQPLLRPGLRAQGVAVRRAHPPGGEAGGEVGLAALAPGHAAPGLAGQAEGEVLHRHRLMLRAAPQSGWWPATARPGRRRRRRLPGRPDRGAAAQAEHVPQLECRYPDPEVALVAIAGIAQH